LGLLRAPEEKCPEPVLAQKQAELERLPADTGKTALKRLMADPGLFEWHRAQVAPPTTRSALADFNAAVVTSAWKVEHATSLDELCRWLDPAETMALLSQPA